MPGRFSERTAWVGRVTPLRRFVRTETGGAALLDRGGVRGRSPGRTSAAPTRRSGRRTWTLRSPTRAFDLTLREWVNSGLMTVFFLVVGLEARREFDLGELRERRRLVLPLLAAVGGMAAAVAIYLAINPGGPSAAGWGIAMASDTALALGLLAVAAPRAQQRLRAFVLTVLVVNDLVALAVIAAVYSEHLHVTALAWALAFFALTVAVRVLRVRSVIPCVLLGVAGWVALLESGVEPVVLGLALGLLFGARPVGSPELHRAVKRVPPVPRAAHAAARALGTPRPARRHPSERAAARPVPPVDELRHRAPLRTRQRRDRHRRRGAPARRRIPR